MVNRLVVVETYHKCMIILIFKSQIVSLFFFFRYIIKVHPVSAWSEIMEIILEFV